MSVFGGIVLFTLGVVTGGGALIYNQKCVRDQTSKLRRENEHLRESAWLDRLEFESHKAFQRGYRKGRLSPASEAEKFAEFVEENNIDFRGPRRRRRSSEENSGEYWGSGSPDDCPLKQKESKDDEKRKGN